MINMDVTIKKINQNAIEIQKSFAFGKGECAKYVKLALIHGGASIENSAIRSAKDYGPWLIENGFTPVPGAQAQKEGISYSILGQQKGDVVIIERLKKPNKPESIHGHIALFDGKHWVSDFVQQRGFYPNEEYRDESTPFVLYRYAGNQPADEKKEEKSGAKLIKIVYPIPKTERGQEFSNLDEIMAHVSGEPTGNYLLGRNGMWHSGIHITNATTPWCALSGNSITEKASFPVPYKGQQAIRCMADGEVIAYRMNQDYLPLGWKSGSLNLSGSFVLVRHYIQVGETQKSGLHFYTLYMHLAPYSAYQANPTWIVQDKLPTYSPEWKVVAGTNTYKDQNKLDALPKGSIIAWDKKDSQRQLKAANGRLYGLVTIEKLAGTSKLNVGDQCWTLVDNNNIVSEIEPSWWKQLTSPAKEMMQFDKVVSLTTPIAIKAGDNIGHMGFYQAPKEQDIDSRYQVHIECISADDNLPQFLQNPDKVGHDKPQYLKCLPGLMLWNKQGDDFIKTERVVEWEKIFKLSELKIEKDKNNNEFYLFPEYVLVPESIAAIPKMALSELNEIDKQKAQESTFGVLGKKTNELGAIGHQDQLIKDNIAQYSKFLSQYDLAELGFKALVANANAFDHLNGYVQPQVEFISSVYENIKAKITGSSVPQKGIIAHNYQRLINKIKSDKKETYSPEEYRRAFHNPMFSHIVNKTIVKHPSDWYYKKSDSIWQPFLNRLSEEAPLWRSYSEEFLDGMVWMQDVTNEKLGPEVWHMHPLVFLDTVKSKKRYIINYTQYSNTLEEVINKQMSIPGSAAPKWGISRNATRSEVVQCITPENLTSNSNMLQFLEIDKPMGISFEKLEEFLRGKGSLEGTAAAFIQAANDYGINECYLAAHAAIETGNGRSVLGKGSLFSYNNQPSRTVYNMYGIAAVDGNAVSGGKAAAYSRGWFTPELAIMGGAEWISQKFVHKNQNTLYKMRWNPAHPASYQYATAVNWAEHISARMYEICGDYHDFDNELIFDIPVYKGGANE